MTRKEIRELTGEALKIAVAENIMKWRLEKKPFEDCDESAWFWQDEWQCWENQLPNWNTDISLAWSVLYKITEMNKLKEFSKALNETMPYRWFEYSKATMATIICRTACIAVMPGKAGI